MCCTPPEPNEWDRLVTKIGELALAMGVLEMAVMAMHCRATGKLESELQSRSNNAQRDGLKRAVKDLDWPDDKKADLSRRLSAIAALDKRRNAMIHLAAGVAGDGIHGIAAGTPIDLRSYGLGTTGRDGGTFTVGLVATKVDLGKIDKLIEDITQARLGLVPFMELVDRIRVAPRSAADLIDMLKRGEPI
jgi:hypothetical protein